MSNIGQFLEQIMHARFGKDVRQSFVDCIEEIDRVADTAQDSATAAAAAAAESAASIAGVEERVKESENNAAASAAAAAESEANALASEVSTATSERNVAEMQAKAKASEQAAAESEANASASEQAAKASEQAAAESEANTAASEQASKASEQAAATSETNALSYRDYAKSYALGTNGVVRPGDEIDNALYFYEQVKRISQGLQGTLLPMGTITFEQLTTVTAQAGYMYNISDGFTTDDTFNEGAGHEYPAGTNVYLTADGKWDCMAGTAVGGVKGAKEATYRQGLVEITPENIGALPEDGDSAENTVTFETADAAEANAWTDVDVLVSGEKHSSIFNKVSTMFKNVRYLYKMLGTTDISAIGGGTVTGAIASQNEALKTVNANLRKQYIQCGGVTCTYYTPYFLRAIVTLPVAYSRAIAGFASKATNVSDASSHVSCLLEGNNKISIFVENKDGIFTSSNKQSVYWMTVGVL